MRTFPAAVLVVLAFSASDLRAAPGPAGESMLEPWSSTERHPAIDADSTLTGKPALFGQGETFCASVCFIWLKFYQDILSLFNTVRCPMHPSCSNYSIQAVRKHGAIIGVVMTADRLLHEGDEQQFAPTTRIEGRVKHIDSLENNDFWWSNK